MKKEDKERAVADLTDRLKNTETMLVADYRGLTVGQVAEVRAQLREAGATFHVAKNTLARIAAQQADKPSLVELLQGPTAIAFVADDPAAAAKKLSDIARQTRILEVRGGFMEGHTLTADDVRRLSELPPRDVLLSQVVGAVAGPMQGVASVVAAPLRDVVSVLEAQIQKVQEAEAA